MSLIPRHRLLALACWVRLCSEYVIQRRAGGQCTSLWFGGLSRMADSTGEQSARLHSLWLYRAHTEVSRAPTVRWWPYRWLPLGLQNSDRPVELPLRCAGSPRASATACHAPLSFSGPITSLSSPFSEGLPLFPNKGLHLGGHVLTRLVVGEHHHYVLLQHPTIMYRRLFPPRQHYSFKGVNIDYLTVGSAPDRHRTPGCGSRCGCQRGRDAGL